MVTSWSVKYGGHHIAKLSQIRISNWAPIPVFLPESVVLYIFYGIHLSFFSIFAVSDSKPLPIYEHKHNNDK